MPKNIIEKIWDAHVVKQIEGHPAIFKIDLHLMHEVTSAQAFDVLKQRRLSVKNPGSCIATLDHSIPTNKDRHIIKDKKARKQVETLRENTKKFGIHLHDFESGHQGVIHVIAPELKVIKPGMTVACGDSHTATHGAFGAIAFGVGTTEVGLILATGCILQQRPKTMKVEFKGKLKEGTYAKDVILALIRKIGVGGATGHIIEYTGDLIPHLSMEERMTICNMSIECGARSGLIAPDEVTKEYLGEDIEMIASDPDCKYDKEVTIDVSDLDPMVTWGTTPAEGIQITEEIPENHDYTQLKKGDPIEGTPIDYAFLGSCTNGRIEDLRVAAEILKDQKIAPEVTFLVVPGSEAVRKQAIEEGLDKIFEDAGADFRMPGCSMCLAMNDDKVPEGKRCISSSNRNFIGRQGTGSITHLASPATVAASAIAGKITSP